MHMSDALLSPSVAFAMYAASGAAIAYSVAKMKEDELSEKKLPVMAVAGAFVFAAQMINFTIPATGSSGHIGGGLLLAAMLGGAPALLAISAVLVIQCLFFADGGLLALGANVFNMGVIPCLAVYPLLFKPMMKKGRTAGRLMSASVLSVVAALQAGAFAVVLETLASGVTALPFSSFVLLMQPIHLAIGVVEGIVTGAVLSFVRQMRPELLESAEGGVKLPAGVPMKKTLAALAAMTLVTGAILSGFASSYPDGLEWSIMNVTGSEELEAEGAPFESAAGIQEKTAFMPDYDYAAPAENPAVSGTAAAGIIGSLMTFAAAALVGAVISKTKKGKDSAARA
ncbi:MAG: energy-coupling factor ABC transporter permease [Synergistaceae bacterium]|nr:energy-coupling factor ABC transporter permease [Synergistaceae bacterium]